MGENLNNSGQGLLEAIIGISIITIGLSGALTLAHSGISSHYEAETRVIAANLAREAVEIVHNIRDSNWLSGGAWDSGFYNGADYEGVPMLSYSSGNWQINFTADDFTADTAKVYQFTVGDYNNLFVQSVAKPADAEETLYKRMMTLKAICYKNGNEEIRDSASCGNDDKIGIRIIAEVRWTEHGRAHSLVVEDSVYNWR
ncbi:hypothetical protein A2Y83_01345 [Candidatus Falkowbacteria bacterium RBG_13_39_14]|uniref:Type 4 fimbrial biogenesis protein PilX N-terminal domain-containing protein n=1 Tax=Candidatus Falkowbacteria bacterium RBG_13_39_14 TaxID=1797985 RepID=A0A1F5S9V9_9BACT|nr:MAG: hypothetical protein A2Y83_01345 [Candidatus Falkowbacteria bacterium RBG_13_39_14]